MIKVDGTQMTQLTTNVSFDGDPAWSSDGKYLYWVSNRGRTKWPGEIWRAEVVFPGR